jgi:hypothetical protein
MAVREKPPSDERKFASLALETFRMPVPVAESDQCTIFFGINRFTTAEASLVVNFVTTLRATEGLTVDQNEWPCIRQMARAVSTGETSLVPRRILIYNFFAWKNCLFALDALGRVSGNYLVVLIEAFDTDQVTCCITWHECTLADWLAADGTGEAFVMPLFVFVSKFLHSLLEFFAAFRTMLAIATFVTFLAEQTAIFVGEQFIVERHMAASAGEALFVPVVVLVR